MGMRAAMLAPPAGLLTFGIGFFAGWRFSTTLVSALAAVFVVSALVLIVTRMTRRKDEKASE